MPLYLGETSGARILSVGTALASVGTNHQADWTTWEFRPAGEMGDVLFRSVGVSFTATDGYSLGVTPIVDGVALNETVFGGSGLVTNGQAQVFVKKRGTAIAARVRTLIRTGEIAFTDVQVSYLPLREWP